MKIRSAVSVLTRTIYPRRPKAVERMTATSGVPDRLMVAKKAGACSLSARATSVRDAPYTDELPALNTAINMTAFMIDGSALIPEFRRAITNGELAVYISRSTAKAGSLDGTNRLTTMSDTRYI